jgi:hypothetical protein
MGHHHQSPFCREQHLDFEGTILPRNLDDYILQERMNFEPMIQTPFGMTKAEIRIMYYLWDEKCLPVLTIIRMGRGEMMGVDHNKEMQWVGSSAGLFRA